MCCLIYSSTTLPGKSKMWWLFYLSLLDSIMYIILNKAMFRVIDAKNPYIINNITFINITSNLSIKYRGIKGNYHICCLISYNRHFTTFFSKSLCFSNYKFRCFFYLARYFKPFLIISSTPID